MERKEKDDLGRIRVELARGMASLRQVQCDLKALRRLGIREVEIRRVMVALGFVGVTVDELVSAKTPRALVRVILKLGPPGLN